MRAALTMADLRGAEGEWVYLAHELDYLNAQIVSLDEETGKVNVRLADGTQSAVHWSRIRWR